MKKKNASVCPGENRNPTWRLQWPRAVVFQMIFRVFDSACNAHTFHLYDFFRAEFQRIITNGLPAFLMLNAFLCLPLFISVIFQVFFKFVRIELYCACEFYTKKKFEYNNYGITLGIENGDVRVWEKSLSTCTYVNKAYFVIIVAGNE